MIPEVNTEAVEPIVAKTMSQLIAPEMSSGGVISRRWLITRGPIGPWKNSRREMETASTINDGVNHTTSSRAMARKV